VRWISSFQKSTLFNVKDVNSTHFRHFRKPSLCSRVRKGTGLTHELRSSICSHSASVCAESPATLKVTWMRAASALALYMRRLAANSIICHGKRPVPKHFSCDLRGNSLQVSHLSRSYSLSLIGGGSSLSSLSFPIFIPKDPTPPGFSGAFPVCPPTVQRFPRALPSTLTECSNT